MDFEAVTNATDTQLMVMRLICVFLLHIQIEGEFRQGVAMLKYQVNHPDNFKDSEGNSTLFSASSIIFMQVLTTISTEVINFLLIFESQSPKEALMNFVALAVISQIDDFYYQSIRGEPLKEAI